jgi:lysophospholipase L1-like esterase
LNAERKDIRIVILGDSLVTATGDPKAMGWVGRVLARTPRENPRIEVYTLAVPTETSGRLVDRWVNEVQLRFSPDTDNRLVIALGNTDPSAGVSISRSRLNLATIVDEARRNQIESFVVGPVPSHDQALNAEIEHLTSGYEDVTSRRGIPFVDCFHPLVDHAGWNEELLASEHHTPGQVGFGLLAWLVLNRGWMEWLDVTAEAK